jgi:effector-binding domain-containing protein
MKKILILSLTWLFIATLVPAASKPAVIPQDVEVTLKEVQPFPYVYVENKGPFSNMGETIQKLMSGMQMNRVTPTGGLIAVFNSVPGISGGEQLQWEVGFPVPAQVTSLMNPLKKKSWPYTLVASAIHRGPYANTGDTLQKILQWIDANGLIQDGPILSQFQNMDFEVSSTDNLRTELWVPVKKR